MRSTLLFSFLFGLLTACTQQGSRIDDGFLGGAQSAATQPFTLNIPFTAGSDSDYTISDPTRMELVGGVVRLTPASQTDNSTNTGPSSGGFLSGVMTGAQWDNTNSLVRLNTTTNNAELDASWTPQWSSLVEYLKLNPSGTLPSGSLVPASIGSDLTTINNGVSFSQGQLNNSIHFDSTNYASFNFGSRTVFSVAFWVKSAGSSAGWGYDRCISTALDSFEVGCQNGFTYRVYTSSSGSWTDSGVPVSTSWTHMGIVFDGTNLSYYINGKLAVSTAKTVSINGSMWLGATRTGTELANIYIDDFATWSTVLTSSQVQTIYQRQSAKYSGQLTSRVLDAYSPQAWTTLTSTTTLPFYKELPGSVGSESSTGYSSVGGSLMSSIVGLWHLNGSGSISNNSAVSAAIGANGVAQNSNGTGMSYSTGVLSQGITFDGTDDYVSLQASSLIGSQTTGSVSVWFSSSLTSLSGEQAIYDESSTIGTCFRIRRVNNAIGFDSANPWRNLTSANIIWGAGNWHHAVANWTSGSMKLYVDGTLAASSTNPGGTTCVIANSWLGRYEQAGYYFNGSIDEFAVWNRALTSTEVLELYRRGANRLRYQLRSCSASDCSDQEALTTTYKGWKGPDNTGLSYFSELYNTTSNVLAGTVSTGAPTMTFSNFSGSGLSVAANRYFQYRAILESDDQNTLCTYGGSAAPCSPELQSVAVGPSHYDTTIQSIISKSSIGSAYQTLDTSGMTETLGSNTCSSGTKYSLSSDGTTFYYWNGSTWATSSDYGTANDAATMRTNISSFPSSTAGTGTLQIKAYLKSSGTSACEVDNLKFTGSK